MAHLIMTVEQMKDHDAWLALRNKGLGGSEVASVMGVNPWKSAYALWAEKTGQVEAEDLSDKEAVYWGTVLEDAVATRFEELTGMKTRRCGTMADDEYEFMHANVDRLIVGSKSGLEIKTAGAFKKEEWAEDNIPDSYYCQIQWYLGVTGLDTWYVAVLIGGNTFVWKEVPRNENFIAELREAAIKFWNENVLAGVAPEIDGSESSNKTIKQQYQQDMGMEVALPSQAAALLERWDDLKRAEDEIKCQLAAVQNNLCALLGEAKKGTIGDRVVTWSNQKGRDTVSTKELKEQYPDVYRALVKVGKASRRFSVK